MTEEQKAKMKETRERNRAARERYCRQEAEDKRAAVAALRAVRDDPEATAAERLRAVELIGKLCYYL